MCLTKEHGDALGSQKGQAPQECFHEQPMLQGRVTPCALLIHTFQAQIPESVQALKQRRPLGSVSRAIYIRVRDMHNKPSQSKSLSISSIPVKSNQSTLVYPLLHKGINASTMPHPWPSPLGFAKSIPPFLLRVILSRKSSLLSLELHRARARSSHTSKGRLEPVFLNLIGLPCLVAYGAYSF